MAIVAGSNVLLLMLLLWQLGMDATSPALGLQLLLFILLVLLLLVVWWLNALRGSKMMHPQGDLTGQSGGAATAHVQTRETQSQEHGCAAGC